MNLTQSTDEVEERFLNFLNSYFTQQHLDVRILVSGTSACILLKNAESPTSSYLQLLFQLLQEKWKDTPLSISISNPCESAQEIPRGYREAQQAAAYCAQMEQYGRIYLFADIPKNLEAAGTVTPDFTRLERLSSAIRNYTVGDAMDEYSLLTNEMEEQLHHPLTDKDAAFPLLINTIALAIYSLELPGDVGKAHTQKHMDLVCRCRDAKELADTLRKTMEEFIQGNKGNDSDQSAFLKIRSFVENNSEDPNLSSALVAENFEMSASNVTRLFKKYNHTGFLEYLHKLRVIHACRLLETTDESISEIALKVGYSNAITMTRAFKNHLNITPGTYRQKKQRL